MGTVSFAVNLLIDQCCQFSTLIAVSWLSVSLVMLDS